MTAITTFSASENFIFSLLSHSHTKKRVGLQRMTALLQALGNPHHHLQFIHVGGTAGKGSTATLIAALLQTAGYKTGLHVSPHLEDMRERMQINQQLMSDTQFIQLVSQVAPIVTHMASTPLGQPSYFEVLLAIAFLHFHQQAVDIAVIEVGLGGTYDGTNVIMPLVAVLTNVGLDHTEILGDTVEKIASDKVGIFKPGVPVVTGVTQPSVIQIVQEKAKLTGSTVYRFGKDFSYHDNPDHTFDYASQSTNIRAIQLGLAGAHQRKNAALAIQTASLLQPKFTISEQAIRTALRATTVIGRFERVGEKPTIILDGAHNPDKIAALKNTLVEQFPNQKITFVFAVKKDKDVREMLAILAPIAKQFYFTRFSAETDFGANMSQDLATITVDHLPVQWIPSAESAISRATQQAKPNEVICVTGSLYLVGEIRAALWKKT